MGDNCATGVVFTRNPSDGSNEIYGEYLINAQGEDVVAGTRTPQYITKKARLEAKAKELSKLDGFSLLCGRYEGVDERIRSDLCDEDISIGDFVLAGGELAALTIIETVARLGPGVLGNEFSAREESFSDGLLEYPQFTRPSDFRDLEVPEILLSGDHGKIERWRIAASLAKTLSQRPDLIEIRGGLSEDENKLLEEFGF